MAHRARIQQLLTPLQESIVNKPPFISGTIPLEDSLFDLHYKDGKFARFGAPDFSQPKHLLLTFVSHKFTDASTLPILLQISWKNLLRSQVRLLSA